MYPGTEQEIFSMLQLIEAFTIERIGKAGAKFDIHKAKWFNQQYLKAKSEEELSGYLLSDLQRENISCTKEVAIKICHAMKERIVFPKDLWEQGQFFFKAPGKFDEQVMAKKWNHEAVSVLTIYKNSLSKIETVNASEAKALLDGVAATLGIGTGKILQALRVVITGSGAGPDLMLTIEIIGPKEAARRIEKALTTWKV